MTLSGYKTLDPRHYISRGGRSAFVHPICGVLQTILDLVIISAIQIKDVIVESRS